MVNADTAAYRHTHSLRWLA